MTDRVSELRDYLLGLVETAEAALQACVEADDMPWDEGQFWQHQHGETFGRFIAAVDPERVLRLARADLALCDEADAPANQPSAAMRKQIAARAEAWFGPEASS